MSDKRASLIAGPQAKGERVWLFCRVFDGNGSAVSDSMIEVWQADSDGRYPSPEDTQSKAGDRGCRGFGRMATREDGSCEFETIRPGRVLGPANVLQAPHLEMAIFARGMLKQLFTRMYFADAAANQEDPVLALVPQERRETLMARPDPARPGHWHFDIHLQGDNETVFFDV
jgi:protocatechuate 3,4-dioxygenase alpha subunit